MVMVTFKVHRHVMMEELSVVMVVQMHVRSKMDTNVRDNLQLVLNRREKIQECK